MPGRGLIKLFITVFAAFLISFNLHSQTDWDIRAKAFVKDAAKNRYKFSYQELKSAIDTSSAFIAAYFKGCRPEILSSLYLARANLQIFVIEYEEEAADDDNFMPPPLTISGIKTDFIKAQSSCEICKCDMLDNINAFYNIYGTLKQLDSLDQVAIDLAKPDDRSYFGVELNFMPPKEIAGIGFGIMTSSTVWQPKKRAFAYARKFRKCKYEYPMSVGYFFVGYETSFIEKYNAIKFDPIWLNYMFSIHPMQLLYADGNGGKTLIYRPEFGVSFSSLAVNYALNIPLNDAFGFLALHNVSIRFCIPAIKFKQ